MKRFRHFFSSQHWYGDIVLEALVVKKILIFVIVFDGVVNRINVERSRLCFEYDSSVQKHR